MVRRKRMDLRLLKRTTAKTGAKYTVVLNKRIISRHRTKVGAYRSYSKIAKTIVSTRKRRRR